MDPDVDISENGSDCLAFLTYFCLELMSLLAQYQMENSLILEI